MTDVHLFDDVQVVAAYVKSVKPDIDPCRLQNTLYFLFALYGAEIAEQQKDNSDYDGTQKYLFPPDFVVYNGGVKIEEVNMQGFDGYQDQKALTVAVLQMEEFPNVKTYLDGLLTSFDEISIFKLITRTTHDDCWQAAHHKEDKRIDPDAIIQEYRDKY